MVNKRNSTETNNLNNGKKVSIKLTKHIVEIVILYIFVIVSLVVNIIKLGEYNTFSDWFDSIRDIGLAIVSSTLAVSCSIPYLKTHNEIKQVLNMKAMLIVIMSMLYFILYFAVSSSTIYNLVVILIMIIVVVVLSIISLINYFSVQEECDKIIDEKMSSMYSGTIDSLPGEVGAVTEEVLDSMENIEIEDLDFDALISDKIEELKKEDKNDEN